MALGIETLILLTAFYLTRRARGTVRGNPDAEPRSGRVRNAILYYLLLIGFLSQSLLVLQLMLPAMSSDWQWLNVILTATLTLVSVMLLPMAYIAGTRKLDAKGKVLNDNQHWIGGVFYYNPGDPAICREAHRHWVYIEYGSADQLGLNGTNTGIDPWYYALSILV